MNCPKKVFLPLFLCITVIDVNVNMNLGAVVYNIIPDIISRLSALGLDEGEAHLSSDSFRNIMKYLLSFIQKASPLLFQVFFIIVFYLFFLVLFC